MNFLRQAGDKGLEWPVTIEQYQTQVQKDFGVSISCDALEYDTRLVEYGRPKVSTFLTKQLSLLFFLPEEKQKR